MNNQTKSIKIIADDDYFETDTIKQQQQKLIRIIQMKDIPTIPLEKLLEELKTYTDQIPPKELKISFSGLTYNRLKLRDDNTIQIQFEENIHIDKKGNISID